jgi:hypothetical protein
MTRPKLTLVTNDMPPPTEDEPEAILRRAIGMDPTEVVVVLITPDNELFVLSSYADFKQDIGLLEQGKAVCVECADGDGEN